jgi:hypothetical protein
MNDGLLKPDAAAKYLALTEGWLAKLRCMGGGPKYVKLARRVLYRRCDLDAWIAAQTIANTSQETQARREGWA